MVNGVYKSFFGKKRNISTYLTFRFICFRLHYLIFLFYSICIPFAISTSEIHLTIEDKGGQIILNELFYTSP